MTGLGDAAHSATLVNRTAWQSGIFEFDVNHSGGGIFGFIANGNGHSFAALFGRGANNGSLIMISGITEGPTRAGRTFWHPKRRDRLGRRPPCQPLVDPRIGSAG